VSRQQDHRRFRAKCREQRADRVGMSRPAGHERNAGLAGQTPMRVCHVHGRGLVAHMHEIEARFDRRVED
jgi:hypothetical protein